jgi:protein gp37
VGEKTGISWCDSTWNPVTGCTKVSQGCKNCYAERMSKRLQAMGQANYANGFQVTCHEDALGLPATWKKPRRIFVNSMSDLFHPDVPTRFIEAVFGRMESYDWHTYLVLTKRPKRMREFCRVWWGGQDIADEMGHIWLGVSAENQETADERIPLLLQTPAAVRFVSCEPLLGKILLDDGETSWLSCDGTNKSGDEHLFFCCNQNARRLPHFHGIDWVIVGGESGPKARPMHPDWARGIRDQCVAAGVPFFFKQQGGWAEGVGPIGDQKGDYAWVGTTGANNGTVMVRVGKKAAGDLLDGVQYHQFPE